MTDRKRTACIMIDAAKGDIRAARGIAARALKCVGVKGSYIGQKEYSPRYLAEMTDSEFEEFIRLAREFAQADGWSSVPLDCYHD